MRPDRKYVEQRALSLFSSALIERGIPPIHAQEITDAPDALFLVQGQRVAVECRYLSHPKLLRLLGPVDWPADKVYEVFLPREPHLWVRDAILEKNPKIPAYKARTGAKQAWLLLHSAIPHKILRPDRWVGSDFFQLLCHGAHITQHEFDQIWVAELSGDTPIATPIFGPGVTTPCLTFDEYLRGQAAYPIDHFRFVKPMIREGADGAKRIEVNLNDLVSEPVCLEPLDSRHSVDYAAILANTTRNANLTGLQWAFYDGPPKY